MSDWMYIINFSMVSAGFILMGLCLLLSIIIRHSMEKRTWRFFIQFFILLILYVGAALIGQITDRTLHTALANQIELFIESLLSSMLMPMLTVYLLWCCQETWRRSALMYGVGALWLAYFILLCVTQFTTFIYYFTPDNTYHRGPLYPLLLVPPVLIMLLNTVALLRRRSRLSAKQFAAFLVFFLMPMLTMLLQMALFGLRFIVFGTTLAATILFVFILSNQVEQYVRQKEENARQRASIMVLQMRPHFIYNTMMSIYYLCQQDPQKAQQVTLDFTSYLRKNFTAIARGDAIPFAEELEHTRAYLAVEQVRFEGSLYVHFDTPHTLFRIPPLTLQPIVENAVKHGVDPELAPLRIAVYTRKTDKGSQILVEDTGPGFGMGDNDSPHIALANIRERLRIMCGGTLQITPRKGGGTTVTIFVPEPPPDSKKQRHAMMKKGEETFEGFQPSSS